MTSTQVLDYINNNLPENMVTDDADLITLSKVITTSLPNQPKTFTYNGEILHLGTHREGYNLFLKDNAIYFGCIINKDNNRQIISFPLIDLK